MAVNISGTVLASLFYDQLRSLGDQTGFLVGNVVKHVTDTISDSQINNVEVETNIYVYETVPCPRDQRFYNSAAQIHKTISDILNSKDKKIVGWYSFRRNSTLRPSYRERLIHQSLCECVAEDASVFAFLLCSSKPSANGATHTQDYSFQHLQNNVFKRLPVTIANLGDTTHTEYKHLPSQIASSTQGSYCYLIQQHESKFLNSHDEVEVQRIQELNGVFTKKLETISAKVQSSESHLADVEQEVALLRKKVHLRQLEKQQQLQKQQKPTAGPSHCGVPIIVEKKPSVDDILFMEDPGIQSSVDLTAPPSYEEVCKKSYASSDSEKTGKNTGSVAAEKTSVKLTTPITLHTRSNSEGQDKNFTDSKKGTVHGRSKSNDSSDTHLKQSSDPFSFVSSVMADSKTSSGFSKFDSSAGSDNAKKVTRKNSGRGTDAVLAAAKSLSNTKVKGERLKTDEGQRSSSKDSVYIDTMEVESEVSNTHCSNSLRTQQTKCSQQAAMEVQADSLDDSSTSQDTYEMETSSSPVY